MIHMSQLVILVVMWWHNTFFSLLYRIRLYYSYYKTLYSFSTTRLIREYIVTIVVANEIKMSWKKDCYYNIIIYYVINYIYSIFTRLCVHHLFIHWQVSVGFHLRGLDLRHSAGWSNEQSDGCRNGETLYIF